MKIITAIAVLALIAAPVSSFSQIDQSASDLKELPQPGEGIKIVPVSKLNLPEDIRNEDAKRIKQIKSAGYFETDSQEARELLKMKSQNNFISAQDSSDINDTNLKRSLSSIKLAFPFKGITSVQSKDVLGYSVAGTTVKSGWTGVAEYFKDKDLGVCHYLLHNIGITKGSIYLRDDIVKYDVNKKPTNYTIEGSSNSGYLYALSWYDNTFVHNLECANYTYDKAILTSMIKLANEIDKQ